MWANNRRLRANRPAGVDVDRTFVSAPSIGSIRARARPLHTCRLLRKANRGLTTNHHIQDRIVEICQASAAKAGVTTDRTDRSVLVIVDHRIGDRPFGDYADDVARSRPPPFRERRCRRRPDGA